MGDSLDALMSGINLRTQVPPRRPFGVADGTAAFSGRPQACGGVGMLPPSNQRHRPQAPATGASASAAVISAASQHPRVPAPCSAGPPVQLDGTFSGHAAGAATPSHAPPAAMSQVGIPAHG